MISIELARALRDSDLVWRPVRGDNFCIDRVEADAEVYTLSDMTVEAHEFSSGTVLGFNGTTEWALDSVALDDALWLPREDQLRELLGAAFRSLERVESTEAIGAVTLDASAYRLTALVGGESRAFEAPDAADAYARALLALLDDLAG
ncbi:hypothetical protein GCM10027413_30510 [Conyzicola nivalis]|uniref:Pilus assembly protein CpaE n=1 Tax=Conyzicola nivalis TaxID=1477021 RepID=A0A916SR82_9MICO|nr:hypothetical protein [Conyzicola nivalis]GGB12817.1 hypothetical protein GCM10010979_29000 [Conyzicola nivalis]